jgi:phage-related protein
MATGTKGASTATSTTSPETYGEQHPLAEAGERAGESVGQLAERATDLGFTQADRGKAQAASGISQVADSLRRVSSDMESQQPAIANAGRTAAEQAERLASYLQATDAREILHTVEDAARRQPLIFLGGAFLMGVAAARFMKAAGGANGNSYRPGSSTYGGSSRRAASAGNSLGI